MDGVAIALVHSYAKNTTKLILMTSYGAESLFQDMKVNPPVPGTIDIWVFDLAGHLISTTLTDDIASLLNNSHMTPALVKAYFNILLFNGSMHHIFSIPEMRAEFGRWLRSPQGTASALERVTPCLTTFAKRLTALKKIPVPFDSSNDQFVQLMAQVIKRSDENALRILLNLFPPEIDTENALFTATKFRNTSHRNIFNYFYDKMMQKATKI